MRFGFALCAELDRTKVANDAVVEVKEDGILSLWDGPQRALYNRSQVRVTHRFPEVVPHLPRNAVLVGELAHFAWRQTRVSVFEGGMQRRANLDNPSEVRLRSQTIPCSFYAFDVLEVDGVDVTKQAFAERRRLLEGVLPGPPVAGSRVFVAEQYPYARWGELVARVNEEGLEGLVVKDPAAPYVVTPAGLAKSKRPTGMMKFKDWKAGEFSIDRFEVTSGMSRDGFVVVVRTPGGAEQKVAVNDEGLQARVRGGAKMVRVAYLGVSVAGQLRQPWTKDVF